MPPYSIDWLDEAKADVRTLDRPTALRLFEGILRFARTGSGDVNALHGDMAGAFRLRPGDYRVLFTLRGRRDAHLRRPPSLGGI
jgi:mRNA-degrading endonuclease RelE of RelBE toxin-antitoxin system